MDIISVLKDRYTTKEFDSSKKLNDKQISELEDLLSLSPSSTNIQPWHFIIATSDEGKERIAKSTHGFFEFNKQKVLDASAVIVFASKVDLTEEHLLAVLNREDVDGRYAKPENKEQSRIARGIFANMHKYDYKDFTHWAGKQVYLNLGNFLLGVAALGIDAVAMEGIDFKVLDEEFSLRDKGFTSVIVVSVGYHKDSDFNRALPKSRFPKSETIERV